MSLPTSNSIKTIQRRLILTLGRAFLVVTIIMVVAILGSTFYELSQDTGRNPYYRSPSATVLEAYYIGHGSWDGVETLVMAGQSPDSRLIKMDWEKSILLDKDGNVILYYGKPYPSVPITALPLPLEIDEMPLTVQGQLIGTLINDHQDISPPVKMAANTLNPILWVAVICAVLTLIIGILLMRRMVNPLAEVIVATQSIAEGNFKTRIKPSKSQDDMRSLIVHINHMTETLERNDNERRAMLADIAHELRTPLSVLRGRLEGILDGIYQPNEANIAQALEETYLMERLVEDLRLLTLAETRQLHFELKETNLVDLLERTVTIFTPQAESKSVVLNFETEKPDIKALIDPQRIEQVIGNLIGNSLRYVTGHGTILLKINEVESEIEIKVIDNGPGVPEEELSLIFERFWRSEKSRARVSGGAGLGLAICKQLIEAQNGSISAANVPAGGLEITIHLPGIKKKLESK